MPDDEQQSAGPNSSSKEKKVVLVHKSWQFQVQAHAHVSRPIATATNVSQTTCPFVLRSSRRTGRGISTNFARLTKAQKIPLRRSTSRLVRAGMEVSGASFNSNISP